MSMSTIKAHWRNRIACFLFGHRHYVQVNFNSRARKVGCHRCSAAWAMHDPTQTFARWDDDFQKLYFGEHGHLMR